MENLSPELEQRINENFQEALDFVQSLYEMEMANRCLEEANNDSNGRLLHDLQRIDVYSQLSYCGNIEKGDGAGALRGLETGIRAAFVFGYILAKLKYQKHEFTPLISPIKGDVVQ